MADHVVGNVDRYMLLAVVDRNREANKLGQDGGAA